MKNMGSRLRDNIKHLFQCFCEVVAPQLPDKDAWIIQRFPDSYKDEEVLKSVTKFAYPCEFENSVVQHYSFVLTSIDSKWTFGFCRHDPKTETALVILSYLPWHESFIKLLNHIAEITNNHNASDLYRFLDAVYNSDVPDPGTSVQVPINDTQNFICKSPNQFELPSIPENRNLTEYYSAVDAHNMMVIFASMLYERRIIFTSKKFSRLSACVQSANAVIYPMSWQHIFIPVLPQALMEYLLAPMPYLIGVPEPILKRVRKSDLGEVVILDADNNIIDTPFADLESLPSEVISLLKRQLKNRSQLLGDGVPRAFLRALVLLIGGYRDALKFQQGQKITFSQEAFIESRPSTMQPFLQKMLQLQIFQQFIDERLEMLNNGLGFSDEFEMEACNYSGKSSSKLKQQYKEWTYTMRSGGTAFFKTVKNKANPAMKSAVKTVKERGKDVRTACKGIRSKLREMPSRDNINSQSDFDIGEDRSKPRSAPTSPTQKRRPQTMPGSRTPVKPVISYRKDPNRQKKMINSDGRSKPYAPLSPSSEPTSPEVAEKSRSTTPGLVLSPLDIDLMSDLQDVIFKKCEDIESSLSPPVDRSLKPVRSLENFKPSGGSGTESSWSPPSIPVLQPPPRSKLRPSSPYIDSSPEKCNNVSHDYHSPTNGFDLFGSTPFVVTSGGEGLGDSSVFVVASPSSVDLVRLPPPIPPTSTRSSKQEETADLIRLDSTPSEEDFDPLLTKETPGIDNSASNINSEMVSKGLINPLYPYFVPKGGQLSGDFQSSPGNKSFLYPHGTRSMIDIYDKPAQPFSSFANSHTLSFSNAPSSLHNSNTSNQDMDLLKEYGLDFNNLSVAMSNQACQPGTFQNVQSGATEDPFGDLLLMSKDSKESKSQWTKFD